MKRAAFWAAIAIGCAAGFSCGQFLVGSAGFRDAVGELFDRGRLLAWVDGNGVYESDLRRQLAENDYVAGVEKEERPNTEREAALSGLIANAAAEARSAGETVARSQQTAETDALRSEFPDDKSWRSALQKSGFSPASISRLVRNNLRTRKWVAEQIASKLPVSSEQCRQFYDSHRDQFFLPERRNVSHLFLAAPPETPADVVEAKRVAINALSGRLAAGEDFAGLVAQNSEDEATKLGGGELGYFSAKRMPADLVEAAAKLGLGEISKPVRTRLGFHILKLVDVQAARQQAFDEVRGDIAVILANEKRTKALQTLTADLQRDPAFLRQF